MLAKELAYYRAHFREAVQKDGVICLECGRRLKSLAQHLGKHQLSSHEYRAKWGYNRTTPLERLSTRRKKRRNAIAMKFWKFTSRDAHKKATAARRGHGLPYRPERRLIDTEAARARLAADLRRVKSRIRKFQTRPKRRRPPALKSNFHPSKQDRRILSFRNKGLWPIEIASLLGIRAQTVSHRLGRLKEKGFTLLPRPIPHRKMTNDELLGLVKSGLSIPEISARLGMRMANAHRRIKLLMQRG